MSKDPRRDEHYVYLYRDQKGTVRYAGYGKHPARATSPQHNESLNDFKKQGKYRLEIAGPFRSKETALAVETALISAMNPLCNVNPGQTRWRFRHYGIPERFANRLRKPMLLRSDFITGQSVPASPVLFVYVNSRKLDGRIGYDPSNPPNERQILDRMDCWWQLGSHRKRWMADPTLSPGLLVGVHGAPGSQLVIGAVKIDVASWSSVVPAKDGLFKIPTAGPANLDAYGLRGRRIDPAARIRFGSFKQQVFIILQADETIVGGHPSRNRRRSTRP